MHSFHNHDMKQSHRRVDARRPVQILALCAIALAAVGSIASVVIAASDPDWLGTAPTNISRSNTDEAWQPAIAAGPSGQIVVAWNDLPARESEVYVTRSNDHGRSWDSPMRISRNAAKSRLPDALVVGSKVFVAWAEEENNTVLEVELGGNPRPVSIPDADSPSRIPTGPRLAAGSDQRLHVVFNAGKESSSHIYHSSRALGDTTWPTAERIHTSVDGVLSWFPALAVSSDGEDLHVVWEENPFGSQRSVWYMRGTTSGSWTSPLKLSGGFNSVKPDIALSSSGDVHVVWGEAEEDSYYVRHRRYDASNESWTEATRIDPRPVDVNQISPNESAPRLALWESGEQNNLCVTWHGFREGDAEDALLSCSQNAGRTWKSPRTMSAFPEREELDQDPSIRPSIVFDASGILHGVWQQRVDIISARSYYEIYHAHAINCVFLPLVIRNG